MITHLSISKRFKDGDSISDIAFSLERYAPFKRIMRYDRVLVVEHAIRQVMRRQ